MLAAISASWYRLHCFSPLYARSFLLLLSNMATLARARSWPDSALVVPPATVNSNVMSSFSPSLITIAWCPKIKWFL